MKITVREGKRGRPCAILIHGLGVTGDFWFCPERASLIGGLVPLARLLGGAGAAGPVRPVLAEALGEQGYTVVTWSQQRPVGPIDAAVAELDEVVQHIRGRWGDTPLILVGHSRGGLVARRWLAHGRGERTVAALVTMGTPHGGSALARWTDLLGPARDALGRLAGRQGEPGPDGPVVQRIAGFLTSSGVRECEPGSPLLRALDSVPLPPETVAVSYGGTDPTLLVLGGWGGTPPVPVPDGLVRLLPHRRIPDEWRPGYGDGRVSAARARLAGAEHRDLPLNHVKLAFDKAIAREVAHIL